MKTTRCRPVRYTNAGLCVGELSLTTSLRPLEVTTASLEITKQIEPTLFVFTQERCGSVLVGHDSPGSLAIHAVKPSPQTVSPSW
jgi:hypothetical protein